jgi:hypothetical protein
MVLFFSLRMIVYESFFFPSSLVYIPGTFFLEKKKRKKKARERDVYTVYKSMRVRRRRRRRRIHTYNKSRK